MFSVVFFFASSRNSNSSETKNNQPSSRRISQLTHLPEEPDGLIQLPLRVHLITDVTLVQKEVEMKTWVTSQDFEKEILPEINRIWKQAKIQWVLESIIEQPAAQISDKEAAITYIQNSKRDTPEEKFPERVSNIRRLSATSKRHPVAHNLYLFPYMGLTAQGVASIGGNWAFSGVWTDKPFKGKKRPIKFQLTERGPFEIGSIARTCSHELGHNLGLRHPDKATQKRFNRLMGGKKHGYDLVPEEIEKSRRVAKKRARSLLNWSQKNNED